MERKVKILDVIRRPDLSILGKSLHVVPHQLWERNMFFKGADDHTLKQRTKEFPATFKGKHSTHPLFILSSGLNNTPIACPCSSKGSKKEKRYIKKGCQLKITNRKNDRDTFLVEKYRITIPADKSLVNSLLFMGTVPDSCIKGGHEHGK